MGMKDNNYNVRKREIVDLATKHSYNRVETEREIPKLKLYLKVR